MTTPDDHRFDMDLFRRTRPLPGTAVDALLSGRVVADEPGLQDLVALVRAAADAPAPVPNAALAAVLSDGWAMPPLPPAARARRWAGRSALVLAALVASSTGAAAANALPAPVQSAVADAVQRLTPLELPRPEDDRSVPVPRPLPPVLSEDRPPQPAEQDDRQGPADEADDEVPNDDDTTDDRSGTGDSPDEDAADQAPAVDRPDEDGSGSSDDEQELEEPARTDADDRSGSSSGADGPTSEVEELEDGDDAPDAD